MSISRLKKRIRRIEHGLAAGAEGQFAETLRAALERVRLYLRAAEIEQAFKQHQGE